MQTPIFGETLPGTNGGRELSFMAAEGIIKWYDRRKGYGFISVSNGNDVFVHYSNLSEEGTVLYEGDVVSFEMMPGEKGPRADKVSVIKKANN